MNNISLSCVILIRISDLWCVLMSYLFRSWKNILYPGVGREILRRFLERWLDEHHRVCLEELERVAQLQTLFQRVSLGWGNKNMSGLRIQRHGAQPKIQWSPWLQRTNACFADYHHWEVHKIKFFEWVFYVSGHITGIHKMTPLGSAFLLSWYSVPDLQRGGQWYLLTDVLWLVPRGLLGRLLRGLFSFFFWLQYSLTSTFPIPIFPKATLLCSSFLHFWEAWLEVSPQRKPLSICLSLSSSSLSEASGSHSPLDALVSTFTLLCLCIYYVCLKPWAPNWFCTPLDVK